MISVNGNLGSFITWLFKIKFHFNSPADLLNECFAFPISPHHGAGHLLLDKQGLPSCLSGSLILSSGGDPGDVAGNSSSLPSSNILQDMCDLLQHSSGAIRDVTSAQLSCPFPGHRGKPGGFRARLLKDE